MNIPALDWSVLALISAVFSALAALGEKKALFRENVVVFCATVSALGLVFCLPFAGYAELWRFSAAGLATLLAKTIINGAAFYCVMSCLQRLELSRALPLLVLTPGLVAIAAFVLLGESLQTRQIAGLVLLTGGSLLLEARRGERLATLAQQVIRSPGHRYALAALLLFTASSLLDKVIVARLAMSPVAFVGFSQAFNTALFGAAFLLAGKSAADLRACAGRSGLVIAFVALCTVVYRLAQIEALTVAPVALVLAIKRLSVLFAVIAGGRLFQEHSLVQRTAATVLMLSGAALIGL